MKITIFIKACYLVNVGLLKERDPGAAGVQGDVAQSVHDHPVHQVHGLTGSLDMEIDRDTDR